MLSRVDFEKSIRKKPITFDKVITFSSDGISSEQSLQKFEEEPAGGEDALSATSNDASDEGLEQMAIKPITVCINTRRFIWNNYETYISPKLWSQEVDTVMNNALKFIFSKVQGKKLFFNSFDFRQPYLYAYCDATKILYGIDTVTFEFETVAKGYEYTSGICVESNLVLAEEGKGKPHIVKFNWAPEKVVKTKPENQGFSESAMPDRDLTLQAHDSTYLASSGKIRSFSHQFKKTIEVQDGRTVKKHRVFSYDMKQVAYITAQGLVASFNATDMKLLITSVKSDSVNDVCVNQNYGYWLDKEGTIGKISLESPNSIFKVTSLQICPGDAAALIQASNRFLFILLVLKSGACVIETLTNTSLKALPACRTELKDVSPECETYILTSIKSNRSSTTFLTLCLDKSFHLYNICFSKTTRKPLAKLSTVNNGEEPICKVDISNYSVVLSSAETAKCFLIKY